jgi:hypothetical protein
MAMRFHDERDKRLHSMRHSQIQAPPPGNGKFVIRERGILVPRPIKSCRRSEVQMRDDEITDDSPMITMFYEAHVSMQQMLAAFAEMRGDDAEDPIC